MLSCFESPIFKRYRIFNDEVVATFTATAPSPQRDFYHLQVLKDKVCNSDDVWRGVYCRYHKESPNDVVRELARAYGWKRVFFTSKLKLQVQIRRLRSERGQPAGDEAANDVTNSLANKTSILRDPQSQPQEAYLRDFSSL
ncbi:F-box only protein 36 [Taenia solium]|eukprot:TsM_000117500 transcript=TsM_000117500 gene=TsM_000117500